MMRDANLGHTLWHRAAYCRRVQKLLNYRHDNGDEHELLSRNRHRGVVGTPHPGTRRGRQDRPRGGLPLRQLADPQGRARLLGHGRALPRRDRRTEGVQGRGQGAGHHRHRHLGRRLRSPRRAGLALLGHGRLPRRAHGRRGRARGRGDLRRRALRPLRHPEDALQHHLPARGAQEGASRAA